MPTRGSMAMFGEIHLTREPAKEGDILKLSSIGPNEAPLFTLERENRARVAIDVPPGTKLRFLTRPGKPVVTAVRMPDGLPGVEFEKPEKAQFGLSELNRMHAVRFVVEALPANAPQGDCGGTVLASPRHFTAMILHAETD